MILSTKKQKKKIYGKTGKFFHKNAPHVQRYTQNKIKACGEKRKNKIFFGFCQKILKILLHCGNLYDIILPDEVNIRQTELLCVKRYT